MKQQSNQETLSLIESLLSDRGISFKGFVNSYLATASWVTCESGENTEFTKEAKKIAENDCKVFINKVYAKMGSDAAGFESDEDAKKVAKNISDNLFNTIAQITKDHAKKNYNINL